MESRGNRTSQRSTARKLVDTKVRCTDEEACVGKRRSGVSKFNRILVLMMELVGDCGLYSTIFSQEASFIPTSLLDMYIGHEFLGLTFGWGIRGNHTRNQFYQSRLLQGYRHSSERQQSAKGLPRPQLLQILSPLSGRPILQVDPVVQAQRKDTNSKFCRDDASGHAGAGD